MVCIKKIFGMKVKLTLERHPQGQCLCAIETFKACPVPRGVHVNIPWSLWTFNNIAAGGVYNVNMWSLHWHGAFIATPFKGSKLVDILDFIPFYAKLMCHGVHHLFWTNQALAGTVLARQHHREACRRSRWQGPSSPSFGFVPFEKRFGFGGVPEIV